MVEFSDHYPSELSGGQKARIACLRAIVSNPDALLLDEPFSSLDKKTMKSFQKFLFDYVKKLNIPCIIVSHRLVKNLNNSMNLTLQNLHKSKFLINQLFWNVSMLRF